MYYGPMSILTVLAVALHALAAIIWVGGMFFAYVVLRPALGSLDPLDRLKIWNRVFPKFFVWVWASVGVLLVTGYGQVMWDFGGFDASGLHVQLMHGIGLLMSIIFAYLFFGPFRRYQVCVRAENWPEAGKVLVQIRRIVGANLILGLLTVIIGSSGRFWG